MIQSFQITLFAATINLTNKVALVDQIDKALENLFNGEPLIMPLPENAPPEIPRIILNSKDQEFSLNISPVRIDLIFNNKKQASMEFKKLSEQMKKYMDLIVKILISQFSSSFVRMGIINITKIETDKPLEKLNLYLNTSKSEVKSKKEVQLHFYEVEEGKEEKYNNWIRLIAQEYDPNRPGLIMINDINSINTEGNIINVQQISQIFENVLTKMEENIATYA